jgi:hypothetical protein
MTLQVTGSRVHRVWKCPTSAVLPQTESQDGKHEPARNKGKGVHAFLERVKAIGKPAAIAEAPKEIVPLLEALDLDDLPVGLACEVATAWNWRADTARELGRSPDLPRRPDGGVDYDALGVDWSCEVPGTYDVVGVQESEGRTIKSDTWTPGDLLEPFRRGYLGDYKSGHVKYPAPDMYGQTLLGALCVRALYGCDDVVVELIHIHDNGGHHKARRTVNEWDLDVFARELAEAMRAITDPVVVNGVEEWLEDGGESPLPSAPAPREGPHCDYCPAFRACPAKMALVRQLPEKLYELGVRPGTLPDKNGVEQHALVLTPGVLSVRNAAEAWMALEAIEAVVDRAKQEICSIGAFEEIPLPDGRVIGLLHTERRGVNGQLAAELLEKRYGREERDKRVEISVTLSAMYAACRAHIKEGEKMERKDKTGAYDKLIDELDRLGGIELSTTDAVKPHVPKKKRLPSG